MSKPILCLDFDGVLHSYTSGWKGADVIADPPVDGAVAFLARAAEHFAIHVFSSRSNQEGGIEAMRRWIIKIGHEHCWRTSPPWSSIENAEEWSRFVGQHIQFPTEKPPAMVTIDDRAITFTGQWPDIDSLLAFKPWNKP